MVHARILFLFLFLSLSIVCQATDLKPWFGNEYEAEIRSCVLYQNYDVLSIPHGKSFKRQANDVFWTLSAAYPFKKFCGELEATAAATHHQQQRIDNFRVSGRYLWKSERACAPLSIVLGGIVTQPLSRALHDVSSFHHGHLEAEAFVSFGQTFGAAEPWDVDDYVFRWWNVVGLGTADICPHWIREDFACEYNYGGVHRFRGLINTSWGGGGRDIRLHCFYGYGNIKYRMVDVGARYAYDMGCGGRLSIEYMRRVYAYNFPKDANRVLVEYYLAFGSQVFTNY